MATSPHPSSHKSDGCYSTPEDPGSAGTNGPEGRRIIKLQVGERQFQTRLDTLTEGSPYWQRRFSGGRWSEGDLDESGRFFVEGDGDTFAHLLQYFRTGIAPLFYEDGHGFDHRKYQLLRQMADYYRVEKLIMWIDQKVYLNVVRIKTNTGIVEEKADINFSAYKGNTSTTLHIERAKKCVYRCPFNSGHKNRSSCSSACLHVIDCLQQPDPGYPPNARDGPDVWICIPIHREMVQYENLLDVEDWLSRSDPVPCPVKVPNRALERSYIGR